MFPGALHVAMLDVQRGHEVEFDRSYREAHLAGTLTAPGWRAARIYECLEGAPWRLTIFDLDDTAVADHPPATPLADESLGRKICNYHARTYRPISERGEDPSQSELINLITVDIGAEDAVEFNRWYDEVHVPEIVACPGWRGARRYQSVDGDPRLMAIYGLDDPTTPFGTEQYQAAVGWDDFTDRIRGYHGFRIYRLLERVDA